MVLKDEPPLSEERFDQQSGAMSKRVVEQLASLLRALSASSARRGLALLAIGLVGVICANAAGQIRLNTWSGDLYDALEQRNAGAFVRQLTVFVIIVGVLLILVVAQTWLNEMIKVRLREWLTHDLLSEWLAPKRAYLLGFAGDIGVNPDQRLQEDARHLTELSADLGVGLLQASLLLVSFVGVLWLLSALVVFTVGDRSFAVPGYMVWCALAYALIGSWLTWRVGRPLIRLNAERYSREAELRFALVRISECAEGISLYRGESDERRILHDIVYRVVAIMRRLAGSLAQLTWITSGYGWLAIAVPVLVAAPGYFGGGLSLGGLMMVVGAFYQVQQALRWFVDNFPRIADWRATLLRVVAFRDTLFSLEALHKHVGRIEIVDHPRGNLSLEDLTVFHPGGQAILEEPRIEVLPGQRILIVGEPGSGKSTLFLAVAGLWPWGTGTIRLPPREALMFMPQRPYLPLGTLRAAITYPTEPTRFDDAAVGLALREVDLDHLLPSLDQEARWDKDLSLDEQQRLAFARMLLHAPRWVFLDDAMSAVEEQHRQLMTSIFERKLPRTAVISMSRVSANGAFYSRTLHLLRHSGGAPLPLAPRPRQTPHSQRLAPSLRSGIVDDYPGG